MPITITKERAMTSSDCDTRSWGRVEQGTRVRVKVAFRQLRRDADGNFERTADGGYAFDEYAAGATGTVVSVSNAGFRGIEHQVAIDGYRGRVFASGLSATELERI